MRWILKVINHTSKKGRTKYLHEQLHEQEFSMICGRYSILCNTLSPCETSESPWDCSLLDYFGVRKSLPCYISTIVLFKWENCRFYNKCIFVFQLERLNWRFYWNRLCSIVVNFFFWHTKQAVDYGARSTVLARVRLGSWYKLASKKLSMKQIIWNLTNKCILKVPFSCTWNYLAR